MGMQLLFTRVLQASGGDRAHMRRIGAVSCKPIDAWHGKGDECRSCQRQAALHVSPVSLHPPMKSAAESTAVSMPEKEAIHC